MQRSDGNGLEGSPCVRNCCLDADNCCLGCGRSLAEICRWHNADQAERRIILERAAERQRRRTLQPPGVAE